MLLKSRVRGKTDGTIEGRLIVSIFNDSKENRLAHTSWLQSTPKYIQNGNSARMDKADCNDRDREV